MLLSGQPTKAVKSQNRGSRTSKKQHHYFCTIPNAPKNSPKIKGKPVDGQNLKTLNLVA